MEGQACEVEAGLDDDMVVDLNLGVVDKTMACGVEMGLDHEAVEEIMEDLMAMVEPAEMETTRMKPVMEITTTSEQKTTQAESGGHSGAKMCFLFHGYSNSN